MKRGALIFVLLVAACGAPQASTRESPSAAATAPAATSSPTTAPAKAPTLTVSASRYGRIVVDASGRTLYLFDAETAGVPRCYGACAAAWPPLMTASDPVAAPDLAQSLVATATRSDGSTQVTYNGHPLYYWAGDHAPGEIGCQAAIEYGGGWYVLDAQGGKISRP